VSTCVDLSAAVKLARSRTWSKDIPKAQKAADQRVLAADGFAVTRSDFWTYDAPRLAVAGATDTRTYTAPVAAGTGFVKVALSHPSGAVVELNGLEYTVTVRDAAGNLAWAAPCPGRGPLIAWPLCESGRAVIPTAEKRDAEGSELSLRVPAGDDRVFLQDASG
jgi:hypothetical protein